jgi:hypothetical protein
MVLYLGKVAIGHRAPTGTQQSSGRTGMNSKPYLSK